MSENKNGDDAPVQISLIVAMANNNVIGKDNALPWRIPEDLKYFKSVTTGKKIIMGRKTYDSIGKPLPGRTSIVITRDEQWRPEQNSVPDSTTNNKQDFQNVYVAHTVEDGLQQGINLSLRDGNQEVIVVGGEQIYREAISSAQRLYVTRVFADVDGDAFFPLIDNEQWREIERREQQACGPDQLDVAFTILERVK